MPPASGSFQRSATGAAGPRRDRRGRVPVSGDGRPPRREAPPPGRPIGAPSPGLAPGAEGRAGEDREGTETELTVPSPGADPTVGQELLSTTSCRVARVIAT
ncbi:hypothetical protein GCM10017752_13780 [Streptomyces roseoviridis]